MTLSASLAKSAYYRKQYIYMLTAKGIDGRGLENASKFEMLQKTIEGQMQKNRPRIEGILVKLPQIKPMFAIRLQPLKQLRLNELLQAGLLAAWALLPKQRSKVQLRTLVNWVRRLRNLTFL